LIRSERPFVFGGTVDVVEHATGKPSARNATEIRDRRGTGEPARFVTSAAGIDEALGATEATLDDAEVKRAFAAGAREVVLAVDASKLNQRGMAIAPPWEDIDVLVTDLDPTDGRLKDFRSLSRVL
jgi:DeoR/GlpR family transcriptional regulator of sugar metabolism